MPEEIRLSLAVDAMHPAQPGFFELVSEARQGLGQLIGASSPIPLLAGTREAAMAAAVSSLFEPGEPVIVIETGEIGALWAKAAEARNLDLILYRIPWNEPLTTERLAQAINQEPNAKGVLMAATDASTGVTHPVRELAETCAARGMLSVFEASAHIGVAPLAMDDWGADCIAAGCEQGLGLPPGLCLAALSERAWQRAKNIKPGNAYLDLSAERTAILNGQAAYATPPVNLLSGLATSLALIIGNGPESIYAERRAMAAMCRAGLNAMGLAPAVTKGFSPSCTTLSLPGGLDAARILQTMAGHYGVLCSPAAGPGYAGVAMGHMGDLDYGDVLAGLTALALSIQAMGGVLKSNDYLIPAIEAYRAALVEETGQAR
jgi:aspartate aminotransferase-like enzyme